MENKQVESFFDAKFKEIQDKEIEMAKIEKIKKTKKKEKN